MGYREFKQSGASLFSQIQTKNLLLFQGITHGPRPIDPVC
jgi:hypothetical protein